jgi:2-polyprenyl-6-hydroxyphenyl methylase/3-demethylubiquinone-9 3-methyltransferase
LKLVPDGTHDFKKFLRPSELGTWIRNSGLINTARCGMTYNPISKTYSLHPTDVDVNYLMATEKPA